MLRMTHPQVDADGYVVDEAVYDEVWKPLGWVLHPERDEAAEAQARLDAAKAEAEATFPSFVDWVAGATVDEVLAHVAAIDDPDVRATTIAAVRDAETGGRERITLLDALDRLEATTDPDGAAAKTTEEP